MSNEQWTFMFNAANAIGGTATALTLIYIIIKEFRTRKQVQDLTVLARELREQGKLQKEQNDLQKMVMKNQVRPNFVKPETSIGTDGILSIHVRNTGHRTYIMQVLLDSYDAEQHPINLQQVVEENKSLLITLQKKGLKIIYEAYFYLQILHSDVYGNEYLTEIFGTGGDIEQFNTWEKFDRPDTKELQK